MILASQSPRRQQLLRYITEDFTVAPADIDETRHAGEAPAAYVERLAQEKAAVQAALHPDELILAADTIVALGDDIFGKPTDRTDAKKTLELLSGQTHVVYTGVCLRRGGKLTSQVVACDVTFYPLSERDIAAYLATGEADDKAGSYGIQGPGALLIEKINGDYYAVMGLPVATVKRLIDKF